ncbi:MAG: DUF2267 domain-containing protein [Bacteroidota bacterium]
MSLQFYAYARKGHEFIDEVAHELPTTDLDRAGRVTRCVLRALRNRLAISEAFALMSQLPMALKAIFVDGWRYDPEKKANHEPKDFLSEVVKEDDRSAWRDFSNEEEVQQAVGAVFRVLSRHLLAGEFLNILRVLPKETQSRFFDKPTNHVNGSSDK